MNKRRLLLFFIGILLFNNLSRAQFTVNPLTGAGSLTIPFYTLNSGQVSLPMSITYAATGVKVRDVEREAGMGWQLNAGGQISRLVRGIPDDVTKDNSGAAMTGWMSSSIPSYTLQNDGVTCSKETADVNNINTYYPFNLDTEPDLFYVNVPGLSCQLVFDKATTKFRPVQYQDLIITYTNDATTGLISSFTIVNDKGIRYVFSYPESVTQQTSSTGTPTYFVTKYKQYLKGITYNDSWALTSITDANGNGVSLHYSTATPRPSTDKISLYPPGATTPIVQYSISNSVAQVTLNSIYPFNANNSGSFTQGFIFNWITTPFFNSTGQALINSITGLGRDFEFQYSLDGNNNNGFAYSRTFLRSFYDNGVNSPINYKFSYAGETMSGANYYINLPDSSSTSVDYWGYYAPNNSTSLRPQVMVNPSNSSYSRYSAMQTSAFVGSYSYMTGGSVRSADPVNVIMGSLNSITNSAGGITTITYESNDYLDVPSGQVEKGGGIRVKQIIDDPGTGSAGVITRNYSYLNPSGISSGKPITLPAFAFTVPYSGSATGAALWNSNTVLSDYDLSADDHTILYGYTSVSQTGAGSTQYQYYIPATNWDSNVVPGCNNCTTPEWNPTVNLAGRYNCTSTYGPVKNDIYSYPFIPNPNYGFEQGLLQKVMSYNDSGSPVKEIDYTYQRTASPGTITAFKSDDFSNGSLIEKGYNNYKIYYNTSELISSSVTKVYDALNLGQSQASTINFTYGSAYHKLPTQQSTANSDGSILTTNISYTKDYPATSAATDPNVKALYNLNLLNINVPVETYHQVTRAGTTYVTGGELTLFKATTVGAITNFLPSQQLKLIQPNGILTANFSPYNISGQTSNYDTRYYFPVANFTNYDNTGFAQTVDDGNKHVQTSIADHSANHTVAVFKNAPADEVAFQDFDTQMASPGASFTISGSGSYAPVGSHMGYAAGLYANTQTITSDQLTRDPGAQNYIFSIWINAATAGTLTLTLTGVSTPVTKGYTAGGWQYLELKIPAGTLASNYTVSITSNQSISVDDILFYPDVVEVSTASYDLITHYKTAETNTNGVSAYFTNDQWGRVRYKLDQDKYIVQKNTFVSTWGADFSPVIQGASDFYANSSNNYSIYTTVDPAGGTVSWDFGDGSAVVNANLSDKVPHSYTTTGTYTITATINTPFFGSKTITLGVQAVTPPPPPPPPPMVSLNYTSNVTSGGAISYIAFVPIGSGTTYSFTGSQLSTAKVPPGNYTVNITVAGGQPYNSSTGAGYTSVSLSGCNQNPQCALYNAGGSFSFTYDTSTCTTLNLTLSTQTCVYLWSR